MSYDLCFWRAWPGAETEPKIICDALANEDEPFGLEWLQVDAVKEQFRRLFPDIEDSGNELTWEGSGSYFQVSWPIGSKPRHTLGVFVECGFSLLDHPAVTRQIMSVARELGCGVYNPQIDDWLPPRP